ncbi:MULTISPECIES: hypothetical protein [Streptomyces]|uniref:hypothetical protein n=1 Tax=Streptomyces TaxID=1883 RepID=UPI00142D663A|nr:MULTISPECIES: hypothetical protein [Streptomyces]
MEEVRPRLEAFAAQMLGSPPRRDQRAMSLATELVERLERREGEDHSQGTRGI